MAIEVSKSRIDKAGTLLRDWWRRETHGDIRTESDLYDALRCLSDFRDSFSGPLNSVTMGIRSMVSTVGAPVLVSQRLKRLQTILDKLDRHGTMKVTRMQDIAGCRAILPNQAAVDAVIKRVERNRRRMEIKELYDYVTKPKQTGYRAIHVVIVRPNVGRMVEVQLRTQRQHDWASLVERLSSQPRFRGLKDAIGAGTAHDTVVELFKHVSQVMVLQEAGLPVDEELRAQVASLRQAFGDLDRTG